MYKVAVLSIGVGKAKLPTTSIHLYLLRKHQLQKSISAIYLVNFALNCADH
jgi:hypothetical protein